MPRKNSVIHLEQALGLVSQRGISRQSYKDAPAMEGFLQAMKEMASRHIHLTQPEIRNSKALVADVNDLFEEYGAQVWPSSEVARPSWLADPAEDNLGGRYPRDLRFQNESDRNILRRHLLALVIEKSCSARRHRSARGRGRRGDRMEISLDDEDELTSDGEDVAHSVAPLPQSLPPGPTEAPLDPVSRGSYTDDARLQPVHDTPVGQSRHHQAGASQDAALPGTQTPATGSHAATSSVHETVAARQAERPAREIPVTESNHPVPIRERASTAGPSMASNKSRTTDEGVEMVGEWRPVVRSPRAAAERGPHQTSRVGVVNPSIQGHSISAVPSPPPLPSPTTSSSSRPAFPSSVASEILGELVHCPAVMEQLQLSSNLQYNRYMLRMIKLACTQNPAARVDISQLHHDLRMLADPAEDLLSPPERRARSQSSLVPAAAGKTRGSATRPPLALVEMDWGRHQEFIDTFELPFLRTIPELFNLVEENMPAELEGSNQRLRGVNITRITKANGSRKVNIRIPADPERGRGPLRMLMNRLKPEPQQPVAADDDDVEVIETELLFTAVWDHD